MLCVFRVLVCFLVVLVGGCSSPAHLVGQQWYEVTSPHFRVITNGDTGQVELLIQDLERYRAAVASLMGFSLPHDDQLTLFALKDAVTYQSLVPGKTGWTSMGVFYDRLYGQFALINLTGYANWNREGDDWATRFLFHEYIHYVAARGGSFVYPYWYSEGLAEFLSTMAFDGEGRCIIGGAPYERARHLEQEPLIPAAELMQATRENASSLATAQRVYAGGWLMVHMLFADPEMKDKVGPMLLATNQGVDPIAAFETTYDMPVTELQRRFKAYRKQGKIHTYRYRYADEDLKVRTTTALVEPENALAELGKFLVLSAPDPESLQLLYRYGQERGIDTRLLKYSLAFAALHQNPDRLSDEWIAFLEQGPAEDQWSKLVYADYLLMQGLNPSASRQRYLVDAYNQYKSILQQDDTLPAAWFGLGTAAAELKVEAAVYQRYFRQAHVLSPANEQAARAYLQALYESRNWADFASEVERVMPIITDDALRQRLKMLAQRARQELVVGPGTSATSQAGL